MEAGEGMFSVFTFCVLLSFLSKHRQILRQRKLTRWVYAVQKLEISKHTYYIKNYQVQTLALRFSLQKLTFVQAVAIM